MDQLLFSPGPSASLLEEISVLWPQLDVPETTSVYRAFRVEQFLTLPPMPIAVPGKTVAAPVTMPMLMKAQAESVDCADASGWPATSTASESIQATRDGVFMSAPP